MLDIAPFRLNLLRAGYLLLVIGLGTTVVPAILDPSRSWELMHGVVVAMLGALALLALIGLRHPLRMLPLLFWEVTWKTLWLLRVAIPLWRSGRLDAATSETVFECLIAILIIAVIPWDHVVRAYVLAPAERWRTRG